MKRIIALFLAFAVMFLISCNSEDKKTSGAETASKTETTENNDEKIILSTDNFEVTESMFRYFFTSYVSNDMNSNGSVYEQYYGFDSSKGLKEQDYSESQSWYDYYIDKATESVKVNLSVAEKALSDGVGGEDEITAQVDAVIAQFASQADSQSLSLGELLNKYIGGNVTEQDVRNALRIIYIAGNYFNDVHDSCDFTEDECRAYAEANPTTIDMTKTAGTKDVRHILFQSSNYDSEDDALARAEEVYSEWKNSEATEDSFAALATQYTEDPGSKATGGLYEGVTEGQMVTEFNDWIFDAARKVGDTDIVKTSYGYHIMYFSGSGEAEWITDAKDAMANEKLLEVEDEASEKYPVTVADEIPDME